MTQPLPAALLAAGEGRRLGGPKALLDLGGQPLLGMVAQRCRAGGFSPLIAVVPPAVRQAALLNVGGLDEVLVNPDPATGPLTSLHLALAALATDAPGVLMVMADFALVAEATYRRLAEAARRDPTRLWRPVHRGRHGHPVWFPSALFEALRGAPLTEGARAVVYGHRTLWGDVETDDPWIHRDIDRPEDLEEARSAIRQV